MSAVVEGEATGEAVLIGWSLKLPKKFMLCGHVGSPVTGASQPPAALGAPQAAPLCAVARTPNVNRAPHRTVPATAQVSR